MRELRDPIECTKRFRQIKAEVEKKVKASLAAEGMSAEPKSIGWCHYYWGVKQEILKKEYGIDWRSPDEMNPNVIYD